MTTQPPPPPAPPPQQPPQPGWWQASDGQWYPPQGQAPPQAKKRSGCLTALAIGGAILGVLIILGIIGAALGGDDNETSTTNTLPAAPGAQREDKEAALGQSVELSGYTATVGKAVFQQSLSQFETRGYVVADVAVANRDNRAQPYNVFDWKLQTPNGQVIDPTFSPSVQQLGSGDLVQGGNVAGKVAFEVGAAKGQYVVIYKPDPFDAARGLWRISF